MTKRRAAQHESVKSQVEGEVQSEIGERAAKRTAPGESAQIDQVAGEFRSKAVHEVVDTEREVERSRSLARVSASRRLHFLGDLRAPRMRFLLALLAVAAAPGLYSLSLRSAVRFTSRFVALSPVLAPTAGTLLLPIVVAIIAYALLHLGINALLRMFAHR